MADDLTRLMEQVYRLAAQLAEARERLQDVANLTSAEAYRLVEENRQMLAEVTEARQQRDGLAVLVGHLGEVLTPLTLIDHDDAIVPVCLVCQEGGYARDEIEHKPDCILAQPLDDRARQIGAALAEWDQAERALSLARENKNPDGSLMKPYQWEYAIELAEASMYAATEKLASAYRMSEARGAGGGS